MQLHGDGTLVLSATDLVGYLACDHLATLELGRVRGLWERPVRRDDPTIALIQEKGDLHEQAYLAALRASGLTVVEIAKDDLTTPAALREAEAATLAAMQAGADVVFQATFFDGRWRGHADFLFKRSDRPSPALGGWSYDVADTKLARSVKAGAILQMCVYAGLLERLQGIAPEYLTVVTGDAEQHAYRADDFAAYFRLVRRRFGERIDAELAGGPAATASLTYPNPVDHCRVCTWFPTCIDRRRADDHLSIVAGMRRVDTERLAAAGVSTLAALAALGQGVTVDGVAPSHLARLRNQARLQLHERENGERIHELIEPEPGPGRRGLATLPEPTPWDVFFDIEADPWAGTDGLEYLLGVGWEADGGFVYHPIWGTSADEERAAFEAFFELVVERLDAHPEMHVYHYGGYESGAIKRLMGRHGIGSGIVDRLLRGDVLVDLLNVVRQGIRASVESYSLKKIEAFYLPAREGPVTEAGFSVVEFERWLKEGDPAILTSIADYNRDDCLSTWMLRDWLEDRRAEAVDRWPEMDWTRPTPAPTEPGPRASQWEHDLALRIAALTDGLEPAATDPESVGRRLLADLLDWHRREEKSQWWRWFELKDDLSVDDLVNERDAIGGLTFDGDLEPSGRLRRRRYRFEPQDHGFGSGDEVIDQATGRVAGRIETIEDVEGWLVLARGGHADWPDPRALIPPSPIDTIVLRRAMLRVADAVAGSGLDGDGPLRAVRDLILGRPPRLRGAADAGAPATTTTLEQPGEATLDAARRLALELREGVLPIQGPPGTGKTYTGARMIVSLVRAGKTVGITAQSHRTISNLIEELVEGAAAEGVPLRVLQKAGETDDHAGHLAGVMLADNGTIARALEERAVDVVAGTAWLFARPELENQVDVLFVDEAGQMSLANALATGSAARSIVLLGDPNQLPMVTQGLHPPAANDSVLAHLVGGSATVPADRGLFLGITRRLHPDVNAFTSEAFYEGRLTTYPGTERRLVGAGLTDTGSADRGAPGVTASRLDGAGLRFAPVPTQGNAARSREEAAAVAAMVESLVGRRWTAADGSARTLGVDDVIVVAPYNAQVAEIQAAIQVRLGVRGNVGTVDRFQGREGAVAIYSMTSSSRDDAPRDMGFLYSRNRLNVAVSRAMSIAIVIASPALLEAGCRTAEQMRLVSALCRFVEVAAEQEEREDRRGST